MRCLETGLVTLVNHEETANYADVSREAGLYYPADCTVHVVKRGQEVPLPFDCIPLVVRRGQRAAQAA